MSLLLLLKLENSHQKAEHLNGIFTMQGYFHPLLPEPSAWLVNRSTPPDNTHTDSGIKLIKMLSKAIKRTRLRPSFSWGFLLSLSHFHFIKSAICGRQPNEREESLCTEKVCHCGSTRLFPYTFRNRLSQSLLAELRTETSSRGRIHQRLPQLHNQRWPICGTLRESIVCVCV